MLSVLIVNDSREKEEAAVALAGLLSDQLLTGQAIETEIAASLGQARLKLQTTEPHAVFFLTHALADTAEKLAAGHQGTSFFILTSSLPSAIPKGRVTWADRTRLSREGLRNLVGAIKK